MINDYSEKFLINFVRDLISDTKQGDIEWTVDYDIRNNRHLKICMSDDKQMKITGIYDKNELEKVSFLIVKSISINSKNPTLLNKFKELINLIDEKQDLKLDIPNEITDYIKGYYEKTNRPSVSYVKPSNKQKQNNNPNNPNVKQSEATTENTQEFEYVDESGVLIKVKKENNQKGQWLINRNLLEKYFLGVTLRKTVGSLEKHYDKTVYHMLIPKVEWLF